MILNPDITAYIHSVEPEPPAWLERIRQDAQNKGVPIIRREMEPFMRVLLRTAAPSRILEIGTGVGYSALFMDSCLEHAQIITIENYEPRILEARRRFEGKENILLMETDAVKAVASLQETFDLVFLDGPKAQYITMLPDLLRLMHPGSILLADNILQDGELIRSRFAVPRRQRTIHSRMREFVWQVKHHPELEASLLTIGDGVIFAVKK